MAQSKSRTISKNITVLALKCLLTGYSPQIAKIGIFWYKVLYPLERFLQNLAWG